MNNHLTLTSTVGYFTQNSAYFFPRKNVPIGRDFLLPMTSPVCRGPNLQITNRLLKLQFINRDSVSTVVPMCPTRSFVKLNQRFCAISSPLLRQGSPTITMSVNEVNTVRQ